MKKYIIAGIALILVVAAIIFYVSFSKKQVAETVDEAVSDYDSGNLNSAIEKSLEAIKANDKDVNSLLLLAATYAQQGSVTFREEENGALAIQYADRVIAIDPNNSEAYRIKGYANEIQEKYAEAHLNYDKAISLDEFNSQALSGKGHAFDLQGDIKQAEQFYVRAIAVNPANEHALLNLARLQIRLEQFTEARVTIDSLFSSTNNNRFKSEGYQLLAYVSYSEEDFELAQEEITKAIELDQTFPQAYVTKAKISLGTVFDLATIEEVNALIAQAKIDLDKALSINPNQASAYLLLSEMQIITGDKAAEADYKQKAMEAVDLDITLGAAEKAAMKSYLNAQIKVESI